MPVPLEYQKARDDFYAFLLDARDEAGLWSTHVTYTMTQGVFQVFRRRISIEQAIAFANVLPAGLRALFVSYWDTSEPTKSFESLEIMNQEVRELRPQHNFSTDIAIQQISKVLLKHVDRNALDRVLRQFPNEALEFWCGSEEDSAHLCNGNR